MSCVWGILEYSFNIIQSKNKHISQQTKEEAELRRQEERLNTLWPECEPSAHSTELGGYKVSATQKCNLKGWWWPFLSLLCALEQLDASIFKTTLSSWLSASYFFPHFQSSSRSPFSPLSHMPHVPSSILHAGWRRISWISPTSEWIKNNECVWELKEATRGGRDCLPLPNLPLTWGKD